MADCNQSLRILLVEDDPFDAELVCAIIHKEFAAQVQLATTKAQFEAELDRQVPQIIVSDSNVRSFDGMMALQIAVAKCPHVPFVFCSGSSDPVRQSAAYAGGAAAWASKDNSFAQLVLVLRRLLNAPRR